MVVYSAAISDARFGVSACLAVFRGDAGLPSAGLHDPTASANALEALVTVDKTPKYFYDPLTPFRLAKLLPHARALLPLREPTAGDWGPGRPPEASAAIATGHRLCI